MMKRILILVLTFVGCIYAEMLHATTPPAIRQRSMAQSTDTCALPFISRPISVVQCDTVSVPGWGTSLGTVSFATNRTWFVGAQIWSDAVQATACNKTTYNGGSSSPFRSDCRSNIRSNYPGNLFSWCAVTRFHQYLCRAPWRVPDVEDLRTLDLAFGGTGLNNQNNNTLRNRYINDWGAVYGGYVNSTGAATNEGQAFYWSRSILMPQQRPIHLHLSGNIVSPQATFTPVAAPGYGLTLRCVRDCPVIPGATFVNIGNQTPPFCNSVTLYATGGENGTIYFQNTTSNGMDTTHPTNTFVVTQAGTYYFRARSREGCWGLQGSIRIDRIAYPPRFTRHPETRNQVSDEGTSTFPKLDVFATDGGAPPVQYQWHRTLINRNPGTEGVRLLGAVRTDYPPLRSEVGSFHYYAVATNACGTDTSNVSGVHMVLLGSCTYPNSYPWGANLGTVSFASTNTWTVGSLVWSDVVQASNCNKPAFNGGSNQPFLSDCRSNPDHPGDLFSWCAAVKFRDTLCPAPWRLPTREDFMNLDMTLGGTGNNGQVNPAYTGSWGFAFGGYRNPTNQSFSQGTGALYWARTEFTKTRGYYFMLSSDDRVSPQETFDKGFGLAVRCVRPAP